MVKFEGKMGTLYQIFNGSGEVGSKAFWTMLKKTALFLQDGFPKQATWRRTWTYSMVNFDFDARSRKVKCMIFKLFQT